MESDEEAPPESTPIGAGMPEIGPAEVLARIEELDPHIVARAAAEILASKLATERAGLVAAVQQMSDAAALADTDETSDEDLDPE